MTKRDAKQTSEAIKAHVLIVEARFYEDLSDELVPRRGRDDRGGRRELGEARRAGRPRDPGRDPPRCRVGRYDGFVALGVVLRGETSHYDIVAGDSARGLMDLTLKGICLGNGILTCETIDQAWARARVADMNKGGGAADAALRMIAIKRSMDGRRESNRR